MRTTVMPHPSQTSGLQHPRDRPVSDPADRADNEQAERLKARLGEAWRKQGQQTLKRTGNLKHGGDPRRAGHGSGAANAPRPMDLSPTRFGVAATSPCSHRQTHALDTLTAARPHSRKARNSSNLAAHIYSLRVEPHIETLPPMDDRQD